MHGWESSPRGCFNIVLAGLHPCARLPAKTPAKKKDEKQKMDLVPGEPLARAWPCAACRCANSICNPCTRAFGGRPREIVPPVIVPPVILPPVIVAPVIVPPVSVPPVVVSPVIVPPVIVPHVVVSPVCVPPVIVPRAIVPHVVVSPVTVSPVIVPPVIVPPVMAHMLVGSAPRTQHTRPQVCAQARDGSLHENESRQDRDTCDGGHDRRGQGGPAAF